jgi:hypothetical protein
MEPDGGRIDWNWSAGLGFAQKIGPLALDLRLGDDTSELLQGCR